MRPAPSFPVLVVLFCVHIGTSACAPADAERPVRAEADPIELALSAATPEIAATAKVVDLEGTVLREGTGAFTCLPVEGAPMCLDAVWMQWFEAYMAQTPPSVRGLGIAYMLAGDAGASNTDPFATEPTADNDWVVSGPHLMLLVPDARALDALPADHAHAGPYVMWRGTPYAHVMVPVPGLK
jgi:hypothetical protein